MTSRWLEMLKMMLDLVYRLKELLNQMMLKMMFRLVYRRRGLYLSKRGPNEMMLRLMLRLM